MSYLWTLIYPPPVLSFFASSHDQPVLMTRAEYRAFLEAALPSGNR